MADTPGAKRGGARAGAGRKPRIDHGWVLRRATELLGYELRAAEKELVERRFESADERVSFSAALKGVGTEDRRIVGLLHEAFEKGEHQKFLDEIADSGRDTARLESLVEGWMSIRETASAARRRSRDPSRGAKAKIARTLSEEAAASFGVSVPPETIRKILYRKLAGHLENRPLGGPST